MLKAVQDVGYVKKRCTRWGLNSHPDERRMRDTRRISLTNRTLCPDIYNIEYKLYICIYDFLKNKKIIISGRASTTGRGYGPSIARRSCRIGPCTIKWVVPRVGSPDTVHLAIYISTILKAPVSTIVLRHLFTKKSLHFFQINSA